MNLGVFSVSLNVKDIVLSKAFYEKIGFSVFFGNVDEKWLIMKNETSTIGLFEGMLDKNILTFNPGWDSDANPSNPFKDIREIEADFMNNGLELIGHVETESGPGNFMLEDPDGNLILIDQHR